MDDLILTSDNLDKINTMKALLDQFRIKDLGPLKFILGMEVAQSQRGIALYQCKYVLDLL